MTAGSLFSLLGPTGGSSSLLENDRLLQEAPTRRVYLSSRLSRSCFFWILPSLIAFCCLALLAMAFLVIPTERALHHRPETQCYVFNNTRSQLNENSFNNGNNNTPWYADFVFVGYNLSSTTNNNNSNNSSATVGYFEHYAITMECVENQTNSCPYYHPEGTWFTCLYNPSNYTEVVSLPEAQNDVDQALKSLLYGPTICGLGFAALTSLGILLFIGYCSSQKLPFVTQPAVAMTPQGLVQVEGLERLTSLTHQTVLRILLEDEHLYRLSDGERSQLEGKKVGHLLHQQHRVQIRSVQSYEKRHTPKRAIIVIFALLAIASLPFTVLLWGSAVSVTEELGYKLFIRYSLFGSMFFYTMWYCLLCIGQVLDDNHVAVEVRTEDERRITLSGGLFHRGFFGVEVDLHRSADCESVDSLHCVQ